MGTVVITGAARGIAFELVKSYVTSGVRVLALFRDPSSADDLKALADSRPELLSIQQADVGDDGSVNRAVHALKGEKVDILYNVAGILGSLAPELQPNSSDWALWQQVMNVMTFGPLRVLQAFLPHMEPGAKVINVTSQLAASTWPYGGLYPYVTAKAGLNRLMRSVAIDLKEQGIIVGILHPGYVKTDMSGPDADITPEESAAGVRKVSEAWSLERSGDFLKWTGETHPW